MEGESQRMEVERDKWGKYCGGRSRRVGSKVKMNG
jgi:hypothetical protein